MINITARGFELKQGTKDGIEKEVRSSEAKQEQTELSLLLIWRLTTSRES